MDDERHGLALERDRRPRAVARLQLGDRLCTVQSDWASGHVTTSLFVDEVKQIPQKVARKIDLMLVHLGGTTVPSPALPVAMVTMDAAQGIQLMDLVKPKVTIPIHYDDYSVFASPLSDFQEAVGKGGKDSEVVYLERGDKFLLDFEK